MLELQNILIELTGITKDEWLLFERIVQKKEYKSKLTIVPQNSVASHLYFIKSGLMRTYYLADGKEISTYFAADNQFISPFSSFISQAPSVEILETIEDSTVYAISYSALHDLYTTSSKFEKLGRILAEQNYLCIINRTLTLQTKTAKEKYLEFLKTYSKKIIQQVPQHQIASFIGITPESLSRIRKTIHTS